jgi:hypothetical protein
VNAPAVGQASRKDPYPSPRERQDDNLSVADEVWVVCDLDRIDGGHQIE